MSGEVSEVGKKSTIQAAPAQKLRRPSELKEALDLFHDVTGKNPFDDEVVPAFNQALKGDGIFTRKELTRIMKDYYGVKEVEDDPWKAFTGGKENLTLKDLIMFLKFFKKFRSITGYDLNYFFSLDEVYIISASELASDLEKLPLSALLLSLNPEVRSVVNELNKGGISDEEWDWLATFITVRFIDKLKDKFDFEDLDLKHPLIRQLFNKYALRWATENKGIKEDEWDALIEKQETLKSMEKDGYSFKDLKLTGDKERELLDKVIELYQKDPLAKANEISSNLSEIKKLNQRPDESDSFYASPFTPPPRISSAGKVEISPRK